MRTRPLAFAFALALTRVRVLVVAAAFAVVSCAACAPPPRAAPIPAAAAAAAIDDREHGRALFTHNWVVGDAWSAAGDGLGPHFNATSCVACHGQGGIGGSGAAHHNVNPFPREVVQGGITARRGVKMSSLDRREEDRAIAMQALAQLGLGSDGSVFGSQGAVGPRNSTSLFGAGLIDAIPDEVIVAAAEAQASSTPSATSGLKSVQGRVSRTADGRVGRFGWKADVPLLGEFVARACAIEIGLDVPGVSQGGDAAASRAPGVDLQLAEVEALTAFVASLPAPVRAEHSLASLAGERIFDDIGCVACHATKLGDVDGIYSDLLLHDLGAGLVDRGGSWGAPVANAEMASLWRTPPLWGVRDSGPWLHDGRAQTIEAAITAHGGEAQASMLKWRALQQSERFALRAFLETLVAPGSV